MTAIAGALWAACGLATLPTATGQEPPPAAQFEEPPPAEAIDAEMATFDGPAAAGPTTGPASARDRKKAVTETAYYLFFVTAGVLLALVGAVWGVGWYKRSFLEESPLQSELFDAATRAEIERHRKELQAEKEAAKRAAEGDTVHADQKTVPSSGMDESPRETLSEQTAAPPDPAVQRDADGG
ncbi:hypothetical protein LzC2_38160 [Planctomycetes bacterium LzC2]|uniref:Transmembrane protein n=1 Tax=Alienimonas chondri TaxID=2681879 RepID=A0ABX1VIJ2_9PLAN|nr:hypothetical protein [Alienimonas chondri]